MHRREGGFYWHMEVGTGRNIYKAYHWPGFASGDRYDERAVLKLMRDKAYEIHGAPAAATRAPAPPKLLPIERVSAISWQGSAGAECLRRLACAAANGPWNKIADRCLRRRRAVPAAVQRRSRDSRRISIGIASSPAIRPAIPSRRISSARSLSSCRTLVDECRDLSLTQRPMATYRPPAKMPARSRKIATGLCSIPDRRSSTELTEPISACRVYASRPTQANLAFSVSADGKTLRPIEV